MNIDKQFLDDLTAQAKASPRRRMNFDLRTQATEMPGQAGHDVWCDSSQRMLNAIEPGSVIPIHRHNETSETVIVCRGAVREEFYDEKGRKIAEFVLEAGGDCPGVQVPRGMYHTCVCLVPGSVIFEAKDRPYDPELTEEFLKSE